MLRHTYYDHPVLNTLHHRTAARLPCLLSLTNSRLSSTSVFELNGVTYNCPLPVAVEYCALQKPANQIA